MKIRTFCLPTLLIVLALLLGTALPAFATQPAGASLAARKLMVDARDRATLDELARSGARLLADYGAFSLWSVHDAPGARLLNRSSVAARDDLDTIALRGGRVIDTRAGAPAPQAELSQAPADGSRLWMVQFVGPVKDAWLEDVRSLGLEIVQYMPNNAYVVWGDTAGLERFATLAATSPVVQWTGAYQPSYRLEPSLQGAAATRPGELLDVTVQFYKTDGAEQSLARLRALGGLIYREPSQVLNFVNISLQLPAGQISSVAGWADVYNVEPYRAPTRLDERQGQIVAGNLTTVGGKVEPSGPGYLAWLESHDFPTTPSSYPLVDITDDGIDQGDAANVLHPDFHELGQAGNPDRITAIADCTTDPKGNGVGGHGNINAGIVAAYNNRSGPPHVDSDGYRLGLGISPYGQIAGTKIFRNAGPFDISQCGGTDRGVVASSVAKGAKITSNSWGSAVNGAYDSSAQTYDLLTRDASNTTAGNQEMLHIFAAGNKGAAPNTLDSPGTAKNVLTVGATEGVHDNGVVDGCGTSAADNADDIIDFSSRGPTDDGRIKPDIVAPGTHIQGPASQDPAFNGNSVCGMLTNPYYPAGQTLYTWSSGTSHSTPALAGAAALIYEYYGRVLTPGRTPSPAMLKALILNTPRYLAGTGANDTLPSPDQGWGGVNLGTLFDGTPRVLEDQTRLLQGSGDEYTLAGQVARSNKPFRVSLVWTDAPGSTVGNAYVNDLDLEVTVGGQVYRGNVFNGANSITGGAFDQRNNVENVFLPAGLSGSFTARVLARTIAGDGVPGNGDVTDQDFALVISNATISPQALLQGNVTNAAGAPIANAQILVRAGATVAAQILTGADGSYGPVSLPVGTYDVTASAYGYLAQTAAGIALTNGTIATQDFSLAAAPRVAVSGLVRDDSGHGWPLYARIRITAAGYAGTVFTNPATGQYRVELAANEPHTFAVNAVSPGYKSATRTITPAAASVEDFQLEVDTQSCIAPGYRMETMLPTEGFEGTTFPPAGWSVYRSGDTGGPGWRRGVPATTDSGADPAPHSGTAYAWHNDDDLPTSATNWLITPPLSLPLGRATLSFWQSDHYEFSYQYHGLWVTTNTNPQPDAPSYTELWSGDVGTAWTRQSVELNAYAGQQVRLAFRYEGDFKDEWYIDDVEVRACAAIAGGLVLGSVLDANTGTPVVGATISHADGATISVSTPDDPAIGDGFYLLFAAPGPLPLTASAASTPYGSATQTVTVTADAIVTQDFNLPAGRLTATPASIEVQVGPGQTTSRDLALGNTGGRGAAFGLQEVSTAPGSSGADITWLSASATNGAITTGASQKITLTFDATGLATGTYSGELRIGNDTPYLLTIPVTLTVGEPLHTVYLPSVLR